MVTSRANRHLRDLVTAGLWMLAVVPAAIGFWLVAGDLAGVGPQRVNTLLVGSLLALGLATVLGVVCGFRLPIYEGPSSAYLAAITVVTARHHHGVAAITGGLLVAGAFVALLALLRVDRLMLRAFTPLVANLFVLVVTLAVLPSTLERAIGATHGLPGSPTAWVSSLVVVVVAVIMRRVRGLSPYGLLAALIAGVATHLALAGVPHVVLAGALVSPKLLPWGTPDIGVGVVIPFVVAGALAAFNTVATGEVMASSGVLGGAGPGAGPEVAGGAQLAAGATVTVAPRRPVLSPRATWRALMIHGTAQASGALLGNVVGTVSRLDSLGIVQLLGNTRRRPLAWAGVFTVALALVSPVVAIAAAIPLSVSAALLGVILWVVLFGALRVVLRQPTRVRLLVAVPALVPTAVWIAIGSSFSPTGQLIANPMLWGVLLSVVLERLVARPGAAGMVAAGQSASSVAPVAVPAAAPSRRASIEVDDLP